MIVIVDYGMGNLGSIKRKLDLLNISSVISSDIDDINGAEKIILPGVGNFSNAVYQINKRNLWDVIMQKVLIKKTYILGICLGMQLMAEYSEEGGARGLGFFKCSVSKFKIQDKKKFKIPHMGWNTLKLIRDNMLFKGIEKDSEFYFAHSYHIENIRAEDIISYTDYEYDFTSAVNRDNIFGVQFHPEKSRSAGLKLLENFISL